MTIFRCPICQQPQRFERDFSRASLRRNFPNGRWCCPHEDALWHQQAQRLELEILATASVSLKALLERDLLALLNNTADEAGLLLGAAQPQELV